ncbi:hypothetical protein NQ317_017392 [Molorchus minor]|uniref:Uncharacterized protein n=1 Tax=Molorchus minor TaxID=1323400 RepID=A0ABQ9J203_9CUCU|nr:hypothetical protein NQ317_017392 [Molorchus minor]
MVIIKKKSSRASFGDDAISYVQLKRDSKLCTVKCKICPEHKVHAKLYGCTLEVDEEDYVIPFCPMSRLQLYRLVLSTQ